jgi:hypothetical protein
MPVPSIFIFRTDLGVEIRAAPIDHTNALRFSIRFSYITAQSSSDQDTANTHSRVGIRIVGKYKAKLESEVLTF